MGKFVHKDKVPVNIEGDPNTIYIRPKMDFGTQQKAFSAMSSISAKVGAALQMSPAALTFDLGAYNMALMQLNIVGWEGPDFRGVACNPDTILELDPDDPLVERVLQEINDRNRAKPEPVPEEGETPPNPSAPSTSPGDEDSGASEQAG